jgi:hypothetical protein
MSFREILLKCFVLRDLIGASALAVAIATFALTLWMRFQFGHWPPVGKTAEAATILLVVVTAVYGMSWLVKALRESGEIAGAAAAPRRNRFEAAPYIRASGNAVLAVAAADGLAALAGLSINRGLLHIGGYLIAMGLLLALRFFFAAPAVRN